MKTKPTRDPIESHKQWVRDRIDEKFPNIVQLLDQYSGISRMLLEDHIFDAPEGCSLTGWLAGKAAYHRSEHRGSTADLLDEFVEKIKYGKEQDECP